MTPAANNFDALRLFAAVGVAYTHAFGWVCQTATPNLTGYALLVFFSISGYLVTQSALQSRTVWVFLAKRALRIYPLLIPTVLLIIAVGAVVTTYPAQAYFADALTWRYLRNATALSAPIALPGVSLSLNGSLWSVIVEGRLYLCVAALYAVGAWQWRWSAAFLAVFAVGCAVLLDTGYTPFIHPLCAYFWLGAAWQLGGNRWLQFWIHKNKWLLLVIIYTAAHYFYPTFCGSETIDLLLLSTATLAAGQSAQWFGLRGYDFSYSIYLLSPLVGHGVVYATACKNGYGIFFMTILLLLPISYLSWQYLEKPFLGFKRFL